MMLAPENRHSNGGDAIRRFDPRPWRAAASSLRRPDGGAAEVWAWGCVLVVVPVSWITTVVWAAERLF
ncbi:hypothetical protein [Sagittula salina]|uniref:Uncharacterized protein n=1 Tax=Sagittula salina TaxID=2820268 RepID=A0A940S4E6_9RHOB|nr:hypothetical protein [Sagittula salina]MBP0484009.1 hypothetical protein [Sagittula salina]